MRAIRLKNDMFLPILGQGTWNMGENPDTRKDEIEALRCGIEHGMNLIDTAEMYGEGKAEELIGEAIRPFRREQLFIVSKVYPWHADRENIFISCEKSLRRLGTDYLDMYLLHWHEDIPYEETISCMHELMADGMIRSWGVSNLDTADMEDVAAAGGSDCMIDQVLYNIGARGIEYDLLPWLKEHDMKAMAYCPLAHDASQRESIISHPVIRRIALAHHVSPCTVMLGFVLQNPDVCTIVKAGSVKHVKENLKALDLKFTHTEWLKLNEAFPAPDHKMPLATE